MIIIILKKSLLDSDTSFQVFAWIQVFFVSPNLRVFIYFQPIFGCFGSNSRVFFRFSPSVSGFLSGTDWHPCLDICNQNNWF